MFCNAIIPSVATYYINRSASRKARIQAQFVVEVCDEGGPLSSKWLSRSGSHVMSRIFIVEDDKDIAQLIAHYLEKAGHTVEMLASGTSAVARAKAAPPDLIVLDLMLPGMDRLLVCQALRADPATALVPIIMLTARAEESERITGLELGADDYVTKPFSPAELTARVAALLRRIQRKPAGAPGTVMTYGP